MIAKIAAYGTSIWNAFLFLIGYDIKTSEGFLRVLDIGSGIGGLIYFSSLTAEKCFTSAELYRGDIISFILKSGPELCLIVLFGMIYFLSIRSAKTELAISNKLFPPGRTPKDWPGGTTNRFMIIVSVFLFFTLYAALGWFAHNIAIVSVCMFIIACIDFRTRWLIGSGIKHYFSDAAYAPTAGASDFDIIYRRRAVAQQYLFEKPHLWKEAGRIAGCGVASALSIWGLYNRTDRVDTIAYFVLICTLILNEIVTAKWRRDRDRRLRAIEI
jgi:hypothetical protein